MHDLDAEAETIIREIYEAFRGVPRGEITLHEALAIDDYGTEAEHAEARTIDAESRWEDISDKHIEFGSDALVYFDPASWRYYIPRYMIWVLLNHKTDQSLATETVLYSFDPYACRGGQGCDERRMQRFRLLGRKQAEAVCRFLRYMVKESQDDAEERALRDYWGQFCPESPG